MIGNKYNNCILVKKSPNSVENQGEKLDKSINKKPFNPNRTFKKKLMIFVLKLNYQKLRR